MFNVVFTTKARNNLREILRSVSEYTGSENSSVRLYDELLDKIEIIGKLPKAFKMDSEGNRHAFCRRYRIVYCEVGNEIHILTIVHSLRKYPEK